MRKLLLICSLALLLATTFSLLARPVPIEQKLIQIHAGNVLDGFTGIEEQPVEVQAVLLDFAEDPLLLVKAQAAFLRYPDMARTLFPLYGAEPEFQDILRRYGENILPPIQHFVRQPIGSIELMNAAARRYEAIRQYFNDAPDDRPEDPAPGTPESGRDSTTDPAGTASNSQPDNPASALRGKLSPEERGWYAVNFIASEGYDFLGQFMVDAEGNTQWVSTERVLEGLNQFFASGIRTLELNYRSGEEITAGDVGWASVDVLVFASAVKVLRLGRAAAVTTQGASRGSRSAALAARVTRSGRMILSSARYAKWPVIIGAGYLVIAHPSIINDLFAGIADVLGYPTVAVQFVGWLLLLIPALYLGSWLLWLLAPLLIGLLRATQFLIGKLSGRRSMET